MATQETFGPTQDINPVAGNLGAPGTAGRPFFRNLNMQAQASRGQRRLGGGDLSGLAKRMTTDGGFKATSEVGVVRGIGLGGLAINFSDVLATLNKELDYG
ncbi:MAG: hypothetical protein KDI61_11355 [Alphaproteobacteria bacterium]|nr:hypothetical protein [Alphaproteobacteria bacterium]MCB1840840.1 hypothetical protein [Alphaproteobacteria bacterium]